MTLDTNLMGLGMAGALAQRLATAGTGPIAITPKGSSYATAQLIGGKQYLTYASGAPTANWLGLPAVGGDTGPDFGDDFIIHNGSSGPMTVAVGTGVTINMTGSQTSQFTISGFKTAQVWVISTTQWMGSVSA